MKISKGRLIKFLGLLGMLALCLLLTGCVVPDDISANSGYVVTDGDLPFQSLGPVITNTPYVPPVTPTPSPTPTSTPIRNPLVPSFATATPYSGGIQQVLPNITPQIVINPATPKPEATSSSLKHGSTGDDVRQMQKRLKELGYLKGSADGDFGDATETAVKNFQANNGLTVDGKAGTQTLAKLYSSSARKAATTTTTTTTNTARPTNTAFTSYKNGDSGNEIRAMQQRLKELGYLTGNVDGDFGDGTEAAVRAFQSRHGLTVDGKAGTATLNMLYSSSAKRASGTTSVTARPVATPTARPTNTPKADDLDYYLKQGSTGTRVRTLQNRLIQLGWLEGTADGSYDHATEYAVKAFQARYASLWTDGIAGPDTLKTIYGTGAASTSTPAASLGMDLKRGDENDAVKAMQNRLKELGFFTSTSNGRFGPATEAAVIAFQTANNLVATGEAGRATINRMYDPSAKDADNLKDEENAKDEEDDGQDPEDANNITVGGYTTLRRGDKGDAVKDLQQALKNRGFFSSSVTGNYGSVTETSVKSFQKKYGLKADGIAGPATQMLLFGTNAPSSDTSTTLKKGSSGTAVRNLQYVLYELGFYDGQINGEYGDTTADAVRAFQSHNDLSPVDGVAGKNTLKVIYSGNAVGAGVSSGRYDTLSKGAKGTAVVELQETLYKLGYLGTITGEFDNSTVEAVKNCQRRNNLSVTGKADQAFQRLIYLGEPKPAW